ncbi:hypothetical protein PIB30_075050, partial [Stylosanthes scabra]|nr:hypothetical protein [Stylosanthes scabra]
REREKPQSNGIKRDTIELHCATDVQEARDVLIRIIKRITSELVLLNKLNQSGLEFEIVGIYSGPNNTNPTTSSSRILIIRNSSPLIICMICHIILDLFFNAFFYYLFFKRFFRNNFFGTCFFSIKLKRSLSSDPISIFLQGSLNFRIKLNYRFVSTVALHKQVGGNFQRQSEGNFQRIRRKKKSGLVN